jgi:hypothetical protein
MKDELLQDGARIYCMLFIVGDGAMVIHARTIGVYSHISCTTYYETIEARVYNNIYETISCKHDE